LAARPDLALWASARGPTAVGLSDASGLRAVLAARRPSSLNHVAFSRDGRSVVTASDDGAVRVWDTATGDPVTPALRAGRRALHAEFSPDGRWVVAASEDGAAYVWDLSPDMRPPHDLLLLAQLLGAHRLDNTGNHLSLEPASTQQAWDTLRAKYPAEF
jgi:WD40 repeat protein